MINSFWWGSNKASCKGINWLRWEKLAMRKEYGGMGFRHFYGFNLAMLGKQEGFLEAKLGHNPSYVWRSIHTSRVVVRRGLRWRLGNGEKVSVWNYPWLRNEHQAYITTPVVEGRENIKVNELIDQETSRWNFTLINQIFNPWDAAKITKIPSTTNSARGLPDMEITATTKWREIGKLYGGYKFQTKLRFSYGERLGVVSPSVAGSLKEDYHVTISVLGQVDGYLVEAAGFVPVVFKIRAHDTWQEWSKAQKKHNQDGCTSGTESISRWSKPPAGIIKCNVDAACYAEQNFYCIGACLRDDKGQFVAAYAKRFEGQPAIDEAETIGVLEALKWMQSSHHAASHIEIDSLHVAQAL
ncbi:ribonuclease H, partial [Trifolium pratense]